MGRRIRFRAVVLIGRVNQGISWEDKTGTETMYSDRVERLKVGAWFQTEELSLVWACRTLVSGLGTYIQSLPCRMEEKQRTYQWNAEIKKT
jgi:hypothetical protein